MTDRAHMPVGSKVPNLLCYEELIEAAVDRLRLAGVRREHRLVAVLHLGHHRQPEGRAVQPPLDGAAHLRRGAARRAELLGARRRSCRWCRCSTSTPGACPTSPAWSAPSWCSRARSSTARALHELFEAEGVTVSAGVPTVWQGLLDPRRGERPELQHHAPHDHRRLGLPAGDDARLPGALRRAGAARLGHDRDEPARHRVHAQAQARCARAPRSAWRCRPSRAARCSAST